MCHPSWFDQNIKETNGQVFGLEWYQAQGGQGVRKRRCEFGVRVIAPEQGSAEARAMLCFWLNKLPGVFTSCCVLLVKSS